MSELPPPKGRPVWVRTYDIKTDEALSTHFDNVLTNPNPKTTTQENNMNDIRENLINVLKNRYDFQRDDINVVLDACDLEEIEPTTVNITCTYRVTVTFEDIELEDGEDADDEGDLENALDRHDDYFDSYSAEEIEMTGIEGEVQ